MADGTHVSEGVLLTDDGTPLVLPSGTEFGAATAVTDLVHSAVVGTANGTLVDCTSIYSEAAVEENFKELATKVNAILAALRDVGVLV